MSSSRFRVKDIKAGDMVLYKPIGQPMTGEFIETQMLATGTVVGIEARISSMSLTVDWNMPAVPRVVDVNDVELVGRA